MGGGPVFLPPPIVSTILYIYIHIYVGSVRVGAVQLPALFVPASCGSVPEWQSGIQIERKLICCNARGGMVGQGRGVTVHKQAGSLLSASNGCN